MRDCRRRPLPFRAGSAAPPPPRGRHRVFVRRSPWPHSRAAGPRPCLRQGSADRPESGAAPPCQGALAHVAASTPRTSRLVAPRRQSGRTFGASARSARAFGPARGVPRARAPRGSRRFGKGLAGVVEALQPDERERYQFEAVGQTSLVRARPAPDFERARVQCEGLVKLASRQSNQPERMQGRRGLDMIDPSAASLT